MKSDLEILKTWLLETIEIEERKLKKAKNNKEYYTQNGRISALREIASVISMSADIRK